MLLCRAKGAIEQRCSPWHSRWSERETTQQEGGTLALARDTRSKGHWGLAVECSEGCSWTIDTQARSVEAAGAEGARVAAQGHGELGKEEFDAMYASKTSHCPSRTSWEWSDVFEKNSEDAMRQTEACFTQKGLKIATIANLANGDVFFQNCISYKGWNDKGNKANTFRIAEIARAHVSNEEQVLLIARKFEEANDAVCKIHICVDEYHGRMLREMLKRYRSRHWDHAFKKWHAGIKSTIDLGAQPYFLCTARRIFYRWYRSASLYPIPEHPCDAWIRSEREETGLYLESWIDDLHSKDAWYQCPWWLDYTSDTYPPDEEESFKAHTRRKSIEASSQRPPGQATTQSPLARFPKHTPRKPPSKKAPLKRPPIEPANKKRKKRGRGKSVSSEEDENIEEDPDDKEVDDVLDIDSQPIENLDGEDDPLGNLPNPLPRIDIAEELWDHVDDHTCGTEPDPQHLFVLTDLRELQREIGDGQC
ncbi:hypothetical protein L7F22_027878 [Adiantum nelumboides]|nr:hypothetical protein [Adiantum nelumboides]MCO5574101.1 hypothetical protein [Adiantum nelumboides]